MREALNSLEKVEDQSSESFMLTKGLYLQAEGEILWRNRDYKKALASLELSLTFSEPLLKEHTNLARCYNAIGNSFFHLDQPRKALEFYEKAYKMQEKLGSENHFDMPMYKNQIGTAYEGLKDYRRGDDYASFHQLLCSGRGMELAARMGVYWPASPWLNHCGVMSMEQKS